MQPRNSFVANCSILYPRVPLLEQPPTAAAAGYQKLEFWWPFESSVPDDRAVTRFVRAVENSNTQVIAMNFTLGDDESGGRGIVSHPDRSSEFHDHLEALADIVTRLKIERCNVPYGLHLPRFTPGEQRQTAIENLSAASNRLRQAGAAPMIEPMSGVENYAVTTAAQAVQLITLVEDAVGRKGAMGLLADLYHLAVNGEDIEAVLRAHYARITHVQVADFPGRHEPGTGRLQIDRYLNLLHELGYRGEVAHEYIPSH